MEKSSKPMVDWSKVGDRVCEVLTLAYGKSDSSMREEAKKLGITYERFIAAAITQIVQSEIEE